MNWDQIQGKWQDYKGQVKQRWARLTDNDLNAIQGKREALATKLLAVYGNNKEQVEREIVDFEASCTTCGTPKPRTQKSGTKAPKAEELGHSGAV